MDMHDSVLALKVINSIQWNLPDSFVVSEWKIPRSFADAHISSHKKFMEDSFINRFSHKTKWLCDRHFHCIVLMAGDIDEQCRDLHLPY